MPTGRLIGWRWGRPEESGGGPGARLGRARRATAQLRRARSTARGYSVVAFDAPGHGMTGGRESSLRAHGRRARRRCCATDRSGGSRRPSLGRRRCSGLRAVARSAGEQSRAAGAAGQPDRVFAPLRQAVAPAGRRARPMQARFERRFGIRWSDFEVEATAPKLTQPALIVHDVDTATIPSATASARATLAGRAPRRQPRPRPPRRAARLGGDP